ncbi:2-phospho-L-lactate transferase [compost metagenome]
MSALGVAELYKDLIDGFVLDVRDAELAPLAPMPALVAQTLMRDPSDRRNLAEAVLEFACRLRKQ